MLVFIYYKERSMEDKEVAIRRWGTGRNMFCARSLQLECGEGEVTQFALRNLLLEGGKGKQHMRNKREGNPEVVIMVF